MKIQELLNSEEKWTKGLSARRFDGESVAPLDPSACRWCLVGAAQYCYPSNASNIVLRLRRIAQARFPDRFYTFLTQFNDHENTTFADIQMIIKEANA
jgi:hypothetical protein